MGLSHLHELKIIHRDLKLQNIMIKSFKPLQVEIIDLGLGIVESLLQNTNVIGTPIYMAPESLTRGEYNYSSDVWSLGVCFYTLITKN